MSPRRRIYLFITIALALAALIWLSSGLSGLSLQPGKPLPMNFNMVMNSSGDGDLPGGRAMLMLVRIMYALAIITLPLTLVYLLLSADARKKFLRYLLRLAVMAVIFYGVMTLVSSIHMGALEPPSGGTSSMMFTPPPEGSQDQFEQYKQENSPLLVVILAGGMALLLTGVAGAILWTVRKRRPTRIGPLDEIGQQAQTTLDLVNSGGELRSAIIRCYLDMMKVVAQQRGLQREQAMTPQEFVEYLQAHSVPAGPLRRLTHLFEQVRYGGAELSQADELDAMQSLSEIVEACRRIA